MRRLISAVVVMWCLAAGTAWAQAFPPNEAGVTMGHWHLNTRDVEANKKIFVAMGGTALKAGNFEVVRFPGVIVYLHQAPGAPPPTGGTVGTVVNHGIHRPEHRNPLPSGRLRIDRSSPVPLAGPIKRLS
jgi:hypothetical protein